MITARGVFHRILAIPALALPPGRVAVIGPNGGGKTTLLRLLAGIDLPAAGEILVDGLPPREREAGWVGEFPDRTLLFHRVFDEIASGLRFRHDPCPAVDGRVRALAGELGLALLLERRIPDLSAGEKALVALAAALATGPEVLVLDEVDTHLDAGATAGIWALLSGAGCPHAILATQRMELAAGADHLLFLEGGRVLHAGSPGTVFSALEGTPFYPASWRGR